MMQDLENRFHGLKLNSPDAALRQRAFAEFKSQGLPTRKDENWKYTSAAFLEKQSFGSATGTVDPQKIADLVNSDFYKLVFINGVFSAQKSDAVPGLTVEKVEIKAESFEDSLMALNWALTEGSVRLQIASEAVIDRPVQILFYSASDAPSLTQPHLEIFVGERSRATLIEDYRGAGLTATNAFTKIHVAANANFTFVHHQEQAPEAYHLARTHFDISAGAQVESLSFSGGALLARHAQKFSLKGAGCALKSLGLYVTRGQQHSDHTGLIDHEVGGCTSYQIYKGLLQDQSRAVFNSRVWIRPDSQKAVSEQTNKNLLLSSQAEVDSKPQLEIFADDVKARHGSTVGQLNPDELFYLNSRGIKRSQALKLLSYGFLSEIIFQLSDEKARDWLTARLQKNLENIQLGEA